MGRYSIGQVAKRLGITAHTLRYYDKEGLLPFVKKNSAGRRVFNDEDIDWLLVLECLKGTGMKLRDIKKYLDLCKEGDSTLQARFEMFRQQKQRVEEQMLLFKQYMEKIDFKLSYYSEALKSGSVDIYKRNKCLAEERERLFGCHADS